MRIHIKYYYIKEQGTTPYNNNKSRYCTEGKTYDISSSHSVFGLNESVIGGAAQCCDGVFNDVGVVVHQSLYLCCHQPRTQVAFLISLSGLFLSVVEMLLLQQKMAGATFLCQRYKKVSGLV